MRLNHVESAVSRLTVASCDRVQLIERRVGAPVVHDEDTAVDVGHAVAHAEQLGEELADHRPFVEAGHDDGEG